MGAGHNGKHITFVRDRSTQDVGIVLWGENGILLTTVAKSPELAKKKLKKFIDNNMVGEADILPFPVDFQALRTLFHKIRLQTKVVHFINASFRQKQLNAKRLSSQLNRAIQQNDKWSKRLEGLQENVRGYERRPTIEKKLGILRKMFALNIRPDGIIT